METFALLQWEAAAESPVTLRSFRSFRDWAGFSLPSAGWLKVGALAIAWGCLLSTLPALAVNAQRGDQGSHVVAIQQQLLNAGHKLPNGADGVFGNHTEYAVRQFQSANRIQRNGMVGPDTARALGLSPQKSRFIKIATQADPLTVRRGPGAEYMPVYDSAGMNAVVLAKDSVHPITGQMSGNWLKLAGEGWIYARYTEPAPNPAPGPAAAAAPVASAQPEADTSDEAVSAPQNTTAATPTPAAEGGPESGSPVYQRGDRGAKVTEIQQALTYFGHNPGRADGVFGNGTEYAVKQFQKSQKIRQTGEVGEHTLVALGLDTLTLSSGQEYQKGDAGLDVVKIQRALYESYYEPGSMSGYFDNETAFAVKQFQSNNAIQRNGRVGSQTAAVLGVRPAGGSTAQLIKVTTSRLPLNVRNNPSLNAAVIDSLAIGSVHPTTGQISGEWIELIGGGWVNRSWVQVMD